MNGAQAAVAAASASQLPLITFDKRRINTRLALPATAEIHCIFEEQDDKDVMVAVLLTPMAR